MKKIIFAIALLISTSSFAAKLAEVSGAYFYDESIMNGTLTISSEFSELLFESMEVEAKQIVNEHNEVTAIIKKGKDITCSKVLPIDYSCKFNVKLKEGRIW